MPIIIFLLKHFSFTSSFSGFGSSSTFFAFFVAFLTVFLLASLLCVCLFGTIFSFLETITGNVIELSGTNVNTIRSLFELFVFDFNNNEDTNTSCSIILFKNSWLGNNTSVNSFQYTCLSQHLAYMNNLFSFFWLGTSIKTKSK